MKRWIAPILLAASLHALAIGWAFSERLAPSSASPSANATWTRSAPAAMQLVHAAPTGATTLPPPSQATQAEAGKHADSATPTALSPSSEGPERQALDQPDTVPAQAAIESEPPTWGAPTPDAYLPRRALSVAPQPQGVIDIAYPPGLSTPGQHEVTLAVYIDENGHVRAVEPLGQDFRQDLFEAARLAFLGARFSPGELNGRAVKSFIRVTVASEESPPLQVATHSPRPTPAPTP